jgi:small-conductance mechanosensitive channel
VGLSERTTQTIVTIVVGVVVIVVVRWLVGRLFASYERHMAVRDPAGTLRRHTTFAMLRRVIVSIVTVIVVWNVLVIYPATQQVGRALLASSAVLAVFAGLALSTPLSNFGSGVLLSFTQPFRLGDRVTVGETTGFVDQIALIFTVLTTDDDRRVFIPNSQLTTATIVNRSINDPRRTVTVSVPVGVRAALGDARALLEREAAAVAPDGDAQVRVTDVSESACTWTTTILVPPGSDVPALSAALRERSVTALASADLLP